MADFTYEEQIWEKAMPAGRQGFKYVAGIDEVGRGAFAGPVVASAVAFASNSKFEIRNPKIKIDDSKKLTKLQREKADRWIKENCLGWGIGEASVAKINKLGLTKASNIAFRNAIKNCNLNIESRIKNNANIRYSQFQIQFILVDAFYIPFVKGLRRKNQKAIVKGDSKSLSIAAASIIAKVYRDNLMEKLAQKYPNYKWDKNAGYGTKDHRDAIQKYGITRLHRKAFVKNLV